MAVTRSGPGSTTADIMKSGYTIRFVADRDDVHEVIDEILTELANAAEINMIEAQDYVVNEVKATLGWPGNGEPSRTNEPPRYQEGDLHDSWRRGSRRWEVRALVQGRWRWKESRTHLLGEVYSRHPAAGILEFGGLQRTNRRTLVTEFGSGTWTYRNGLAPRPYYRPTLARIADRLGKVMSGDGI